MDPTWIIAIASIPAAMYYAWKILKKLAKRLRDLLRKWLMAE